MKRFLGIFASCLLLVSAGCMPAPPLDPAIGEAYAGPASLSLRQDIPPQSAVVVTVGHGERLEILQRRRRFVKVRTAKQLEGWTDERMLLSPDEVASLRQLAEQSKSAPSQGVATSYETLNVHLTPDRQSPSFLQVKEGEKVNVIGRRVTPRTSPAPKLPRPAQKERTKKQSKESKNSKTIPPPPMPPPPGLPAHWLDLSGLSAPGGAVVQAKAEEPKPVPMDDWSLIRNSAGESGWVLTRRLVMAIPDEVAQYAEGRRITSYFPLGETRDASAVKQSWLWTTVEHGLTSYDFDSFRVFVWSLRRHRYETAHIERNLIGYSPVLVNPVLAPKGRTGKGQAEGGGKVPGFSILVQKKDGLRYRRNFAFFENQVRLSSEEQVEVKPLPTTSENGPSLVASTGLHPIPREERGFYRRLREQLGGWRRRLFGQ